MLNFEVGTSGLRKEESRLFSKNPDRALMPLGGTATGPARMPQCPLGERLSPDCTRPTHPHRIPFCKTNDPCGARKWARLLQAVQPFTALLFAHVIRIKLQRPGSGSVLRSGSLGSDSRGQRVWRGAGPGARTETSGQNRPCSPPAWQLPAAHTFPLALPACVPSSVTWGE